MRLSKHIATKDKDRFGRDREKIVELKVLDSRVNLRKTQLSDLLKFLCIATRCNSKCNDCLLKNEESFKKYLEEWGLTNE